MKGNTLSEFINSLYANCDKEISFHNRTLMIEGWQNPKDLAYTLRVFEVSEESPELFSITDSNRSNCVSAFEKAKIFDGKTLYEAEKDIEVLYD